MRDLHVVVTFGGPLNGHARLADSVESAWALVDEGGYGGEDRVFRVVRLDEVPRTHSPKDPT